MRVTKYTHACVRLEHEGRVLVIDPGEWTEAAAVTGADAVLITHEHPDHFDPAKLAGLTAADIFAPAGADLGGLDCTRLAPGQELTAAEFAVRAVGGRHALVYQDKPDCANLGYLVNGDFYHPGDSLYPPGQPVQTLCAPVQASWLKLAEALDFITAISPGRLIAIHDGQLNQRGIEGASAWLAAAAGPAYRYLGPGDVL
jgi:L-ascorbate metabolism protein UlaG (beta-lactamase superfamily)